MSKFTILFIALLFISLPSWGEDSLSYTGRLVNTDGSPVAGPVDLKLELAYIDDADVSIFSVKCTKTLSSVPLTNGVFHVKISYSSTECGGNSIAKILASVPSGESPGIRVTDVTDPLAPKAYSFQGIHSVPYASVSKTLFQNGATNGQVLMWNGSEWTPAGVTVGSSDITDGSIVDADVASGAAIAQSKIANLTTDLASKQPLDDDLTALSGLAGTGVLVRTGAGSATTRQIEGTANRITVANGDGLTGNPVVDIAAGLLPSPASGDAGKFLMAIGLNAASWEPLDSASVTNALGYTPIDKASDTMLSGTFDFNGASVVRVLDPILGTDAANKQYVDGQISGAANQWEQASGNVYRSTGLVGIGVIPSMDQLEVAGNAALTGKLRLKSDNTNYVELKAPASLAATLIFNLPGSYGTSGYALITDGTGNLSWSSVATTSTSVGGDLSGTIANAQIVSGAVGSTEIADLSIVNSDIANTTITYGKLNLLDGDIPQAKVNGLDTALGGKEPTITAGTTAQYWRGDKTWQTLDTSIVPEMTNLYFTEPRVLGTDLAGFTSTTGTVSSTDTVLSAIGKLSGNQGNYVLKAGDTMSGALGMGGFKITGLADPGVATDGATKGYVDTAVGAITSSQWTTNGTSIYYNTGNVGVGTSTPGTDFTSARTMHMKSSGRSSLVIEGSDTNYATLVLASGPQDSIDEWHLNTFGSAGQKILNFWNGGNRVSFLQNGFVGIGTTNPVQKFEISDSANIRTIVRNTTESTSYMNSIDFVTGTGSLASTNVVGRVGAVITQADPSTLMGDLVFHTNAGDSVVERMRVTGSGNVGIGTTNPTANLQVGQSALTGTPAATVESKRLAIATQTHTGGAFDIWERDTPSNANLDFRYGSTNVFTIQHTGNVGVGTQAPDALFHTLKNFNGLSNVTAAHVQGTDAGPTNTDVYFIQKGSSGGFSDFGLINAVAGGSSKFYVRGDGNVGIGTTTPSQKLHVAGAGVFTDGTSNIGLLNRSDSTLDINTYDAKRSMSIHHYGGSSTMVQWYYCPSGACAQKFIIDTAGNVAIAGTLTQSSDERLKKDIDPLSESLNKILSLQGVSYYWKDSPDKNRQIGLIAQDVQKVFPEAVKKNEDGFLSVGYQNLVAPIIEAIRELSQKADNTDKKYQREIASLKEENELLRKQNEDFEKRLEALEAKSQKQP